MKDSTTLDAPPSSTFTEFNVRLEKGKPHFIRLQDRVVRDLEKQLAEGREQSGILLGSIEGSDTCTIAVEGFEAAAKPEDRVRADGSRKIVGLYRSDPRPDFALDSADRSLFQRCFAKEARVLLLIKPVKTDVRTAMFLLGENGQLAIDRATVEFPFNLRELGGEESPAVPPVVVAAPVAAAKPAGGGMATKLGGIAVLVIAAGLGLKGLRVSDAPKPQPPPQLQQQQQVIAEQPAPVVEPPPAAVISKPVPVPAPIKAVKTPTVVAPKVDAVRPRVFEAPPAVAENVVARPPAPVQAPPTPVAQTRTVIPTPVAPAVNAPAAPAAVVTPVTPPRAVEPAISVTPPRVSSQVAPAIPDNLRRSINGEVVVKIKVHVDAIGRVIAAEPVSGGSSLTQAVAGSVISAVKQWQFDPARRGEQKVPGDVVLSFTFRK